jgi:hypothetical protein
LSAEKIYIEDVFSTYLYTGNGSTQTITNGIDLAGEGGLVWIKSRSAATNHQLFDTERGATEELISNSTAAEAADADTLTAFNADGFDLGADSNTNTSAATYASWTFRKAAKFFDVVTYTGDGSNRTIAHNLDSVPGCIIVKRTDTTGDWQIYHQPNGNTLYQVLNSTAARVASSTRWNNTTPTSTVFSLGTEATVNASGGTYVAYLFATNAGGFGDAGNDDVINCGAYIGNGSATGKIITLGWEPQWLLIKRAFGGTGDWNLIDNMRGFVVGGTDSELNPNLTNAESTDTFVTPLPTGFEVNTTDAGYNTSASGYIFIAIRRGPMKTPTSGTEVYNAIARTGTGATATVSGLGFPLDLIITKAKSNANYQIVVRDRLRGTNPLLQTHATSSEITDTTAGITSFLMDGFAVGADGTGMLSNTTNQNTIPYINWAFRRAPGFFDVVAYTGTGSTRTVSHKLGVAPELMIVKNRSDATGRAWAVYAGDATDYLVLNTDAATADDIAYWNDTAPTSSVFSVGTSNSTNESSDTFIAYLFATCPGVSKVGSYTGTGTTLSIDCGFTAGARFVLIKRTDSTGDWYVWDTARGIISGNDPYLLLNSTAAEITNTDYIDPLSSGFQISSTAPAAINNSGGSFIFLAIA